MPDHNNKMCLKQVTLVAITSVKLYETVRAMQYSMRGIEFGDVVLLSDKRPFYLPKQSDMKRSDILEMWMTTAISAYMNLQIILKPIMR